MLDENSHIQQLRELLGLSSGPTIMEVERGAIRRFADAIDASNPLYYDVEYAKNSPYSELICPPGFFGWPVKMNGGDLMDKLLEAIPKAGFPGIVHGSTEIDFYLPIRAGDILACVWKIIDISERRGKAGKLLSGTVEATFVNQNGDVVAKRRRTIIGRQLR